MEFKVQREIDWPGGNSPANLKWATLHDELDKLFVGGKAAAFLLENKKETASAQASISFYATKQGAKKRGWRYETTVRDNSLFVRKVAIARGER